ncbi:hypothetical protein [Chelativorans sp. J32]|uniref:hypothetical protein n=1 Tax=Chelativorans sp. J32 TaxID=935840 RepID=UPI0004B48229|nr:hypothetical protein [Chelativorans sp. J32]
MDSENLNLLSLQPGDKVVLTDGAVVEITDNPGDGVWVFGRYLAHPDAAKVEAAEEQPIFAQDIQGVQR